MSCLSFGFAFVGIPLSAGKAHAAVAVNKEFNPISISVNQTSTLTIQLFNSNFSAATNTSITDNLPSGLVIANPAMMSNTCGGTVTANPGGTSIQLSGGTIPAATSGTPGNCQITLKVIASTPNTYVNTIVANTVTSSQGTNPLAANATLTVSSGIPITGSKSFSPSTVHGNGSPTTMTITLNNSNAFPLTNTGFTDNLPAGLKVATTPSASTTCGSGTVTAVAGSNTVSLSGGTIPASSSCTVTVKLEASNPNDFQDGNVKNTIVANNAITTEGITNTSPIEGSVKVQTGAEVNKAFSPSNVQTGETSVLTLTLHNFNSTPITSANITDTMPSGLTVTGLVNNTCGGTVIFTATQVQLSGGTVPAAPSGSGSGSCQIQVNVTANTSGSYKNDIPAGNLNGVNYPATNATLTVSQATPVSLSKSFSPSTSVQGGQSTLTITLSNTANSQATITSFTDDLKTMGSGFTVASSPAASTTCSGGTVNATAGSTVITMNSGTIPAKSSCTITVPVQVAINAPINKRKNTIAINGLQTNLGNNTAIATAELDVKSALSLSKSFSPGTVPVGGVTRLTITVARNSGAPAFTGINLTDNLPTGHKISSTPNLTNSCNGTLSASTNSTQITLSGGTLPTVGSCSISVNVQVPNTTGSDENIIPKNSVITDQGATNTSDAKATVTRINSFVTLNKSFSPTSINYGGTSTLNILILNNNANAIKLTGVALIDEFPTGMKIASSPNATFTGSGCSGGTIVANPGSNQVSLSNATINVGAQCTLTVKVTSDFVGNLTNELPNNLVTSNESVTNNNKPSATLTLLGTADIEVVKKDDGVSSVAPGATTTYTIIVRNNGPDNVAGIYVADLVPPGLTFTNWSCNATNGSSCDQSSGTGELNITVSLLKNGTATLTVDAQVALNASGTITNTATVTTPPTVSDPNNDNNSASDTNNVAATANNPNVILVKRITAINHSMATNSGDELDKYKDDPSSPYDDNNLDTPTPDPKDTDKWPNPNTFLIGGINGGKIHPGDEVEYTIYYLSTGDNQAKNVVVCDRIPSNVTFLPTAFNSFTPKNNIGLQNTDRGIIWLYNGNTESLTNIKDGDVAQYFPPGEHPTDVYPTVDCGGENTNGAIVVNLGDLPKATASGMPTNSYGFIRFQGRVK
ncbi:hypothetical protein [Fischerella sp. JS2]|uniref:DUF7933 domain-containing protein n=1 Tax=Fischerella sp. JS2 TaxID=2597771 RepID=UPI0028EE7A47|nr:hypothetical protein [Fischerella sp. JS2]